MSTLELIAAGVLLAVAAYVIRRRLVHIEVVPIDTWDFGPPEQLERRRAADTAGATAEVGARRNGR